LALLNFQQLGSGPDVILIHGLFGSLENLNMVAKHLATSYCVTQVDVRNHGLSFQENSMEYSELAQDVISLMDHLYIAKADILGHSMGGKIAMQLALTFPERVNKLIVADIAPVEYPPHHESIIAGLQSINLSQVKQRKDADRQLAPYVDNMGVRQFLLRNLASQDGNFYFKCNLEYIAHCYPQIMQAYSGDSRFDGQTLFIKGSESDYIRSEHRAIIGRLFPHASAKIIQGAGHWLHAEKTTAFNKVVSDFLAK